MTSQAPNDLLIPVDIEPFDNRPRQSRVAAFVPIVLALAGVGAILLGGISAKNYETAASEALDPMITGSIAPSR